jgi:serralysin
VMSNVPFVDAFLGNDTLRGSKFSDVLRGGANNDKIWGNAGSDRLDGGTGKDTLTGGLGRDLLTGRADRDYFDYNSKSETLPGGSNRDQILDFSRSQTDRIDLRDIDADTSSNSGNDKFKFIGKDSFKGGGGELRYIDQGASCLVRGDINGDKKADFEITVNIGSLKEGDFFL